MQYFSAPLAPKRAVETNLNVFIHVTLCIFEQSLVKTRLLNEMRGFSLILTNGNTSSRPDYVFPSFSLLSRPFDRSDRREPTTDRVPRYVVSQMWGCSEINAQ